MAAMSRASARRASVRAGGEGWRRALEEQELDIAERRSNELGLRLEHSLGFGDPRRDELDVFGRRAVGAVTLVLEDALAPALPIQARRVVGDEAFRLQPLGDALFAHGQAARNNGVDLASGSCRSFDRGEVIAQAVEEEGHPTADDDILSVAGAGARASDEQLTRLIERLLGRHRSI